MGFFVLVISVFIIGYIAVKLGNSSDETEYNEQADVSSLDQQAYGELLFQAMLMKDKTTQEQLEKLTYRGNLPQRRGDGGYLSMYQKLRILRIRGIQYRGNLDKYVGHSAGQIVSEPDNEYDEDAIKIESHDGCLLGYVPREHTEWVRTLIGAEHIFEPYFVGIEIEKLIDGYIGFVYIKSSDA